MFRIILTVVVLSVIMISPAAGDTPDRVSIRDYIKTCEGVSSRIDSAISLDKIHFVTRRNLLNDLKRMDSTFIMVDPRGNEYIIESSPELKAAITALSSDTTPDQTILTKALSALSNSLSRDVEASKKILERMSDFENSYTTEELNEILPENENSFSVIQPGSEHSNRQTEEQITWIENLLDSIYKALGRIMSWLNEHVSAPGIQIPAGGALINLNWFVVVIIIGVLVYFLFTITPMLKRGKAIVEDPITEEGVVSLSMRKALERSELMASANDFTGALKELLKGFFMGLDEIGNIPYRRSRTNREYQRVIHRKLPKYAGFAQDFLPYMEGILYAGRAAEESRFYYFRDILRKNFEE